jgi:hypothetical protein
MKAKVLIAFTDRENMADVYYPGDVFVGTEKRVNELVTSGHVEVVKTTRRRKPKE